MTIAQNFASKFAVAFVAVAMIFSMFASAVSAQESNEDLQDTINDLLAQIAALQAGMETTTTTTTTTTTCDVPMAPLTVGAQGGGVTALQNILIADGHVIAAGATGYFGAQTKAALAAWQAANGVAPAAGFYGPITMAALQADCTPAGEDDEDEDDEDDNSSDELQGEGTLDMFEIDDAPDSDIQEGAEDEVIAEITAEATDGDIELDRMDLRLINVDGSDDPWEVFETITLWVDGDMIAEFSADDEDEYLNEDNGTFRFTGIDLVLNEDEEVEIQVGATVMSSVDDDLTGGNTWTVQADEVRYFDADGVADDDSSTDDLTGTTVSFDIVEAGDGEELKFSLGDNNPDATDIIVEENKKTDGVTILEYTIEAEEGDIELNTLYVTVETSATTTAILDDIELVIDGETFKDDGVTANSAFTNTNTKKTYEFDIDGDIVVDADDEVTVEVVVDLKAQDPNGNSAGVAYVNGSVIEAYVNGDERDETDAEGADDVTEFSGTAIGEEHTLVAEGIVIPVDGFTSEVDLLGQNDTIGEFTLEFEVTAIEGDFYIADNSTTSTAVSDGAVFSVSGGAAVITSVLDSTGDEANGAFKVSEGETETFTLTVTVDPAAAGTFRVTLDEVWYATATNGTGGTAYLPTPVTDFRSAQKAINN